MLSKTFDNINKSILSRKLRQYESEIREKSALILLDVTPASLGTDPALETELRRLLARTRRLGVLTVLSNVNGKHPDRSLPAGLERLFTEAEQEAPVGLNVDKVLAPRSTLSIFYDPEFEKLLQDKTIERLAFAGGYADLSIDSSARHASEMGFHTTVLADCCGATSPEAHRATTHVTLPRMIHSVSPASQWLERVAAERPEAVA